MRWLDRVYGDSEIADPDLLALIDSRTFQRLRGVRQAGPSALAFPFKNVTRFEHSLGVYSLLRRLGANRREQVAGLLHDISHTAFSHAVDFLYSSEEQNHHEGLKPQFLRRPDLEAAIRRLGFEPADFDDDSIYPLLEQPLPRLCADRIDYFLRDGLACQVVRPEDCERILDALLVQDDRIVVRDVDTARLMADRFAMMNRDWWASPTEGFIYNEFAAALKRGVALGVITESDLLTEDLKVLAKLRASGDAQILRTLEHIEHFDIRHADAYVPQVEPKVRWLDPDVLVGPRVVPLSKC